MLGGENTTNVHANTMEMQEKFVDNTVQLDSNGMEIGSPVP